MRSLYLFCRKGSSVGVMPIKGKGMQMNEGDLQGHLPLGIKAIAVFYKSLFSEITRFADFQIIISFSPPLPFCPLRFTLSHAYYKNIMIRARKFFCF